MSVFASALVHRQWQWLCVLCSGRLAQGAIVERIYLAVCEAVQVLNCV